MAFINIILYKQVDTQAHAKCGNIYGGLEFRMLLPKCQIESVLCVRI